MALQNITISTDIDWNTTQRDNYTEIERHNKTDGEFTDKVINDITRWIAVTLFVGIITLNSLVIMLLFRRGKKSRMTFFVKNLAFADLCIGFIFVLPEIIVYRFNVGWVRETCHVFNGIKMFPVYASTFAIVVLTIDRLYVIIRPITSATNGVKYRCGLLVPTWILSGLLSILHILNVTFDNGYCFNKFNPKAVVMFDIIVNLLLPVLVIGICYTWIIVTIWRREHNGVLAGEYRNTTETMDDMKCGMNYSYKTGLITKAKIRTIKLVFIVVIAYIVCWCPVCIGVALNTWNVIQSGIDFQLLYVLAPLNSMVNPLIFLLFNRKMFYREKSNKRRYVALGTFATTSIMSNLKSSPRMSNDNSNLFRNSTF